MVKAWLQKSLVNWKSGFKTASTSLSEHSLCAIQDPAHKWHKAALACTMSQLISTSSLMLLAPSGNLTGFPWGQASVFILFKGDWPNVKSSSLSSFLHTSSHVVLVDGISMLLFPSSKGLAWLISSSTFNFFLALCIEFFGFFAAVFRVFVVSNLWFFSSKLASTIATGLFYEIIKRTHENYKIRKELPWNIFRSKRKQIINTHNSNLNESQGNYVEL